MPLTPKQKAFRTSLLRHIHTAPVYLELYKDDDPAYRTMLNDNFNKKSAAQLSIKQLIVLKDYLQGKTAQPVEHISQAQVNYIKTLWQQHAHTPTMPALRQFINKLFKKTVLHLNALTKTEANGIVNAIKRMK